MDDKKEKTKRRQFGFGHVPMNLTCIISSLTDLNGSYYCDQVAVRKARAILVTNYL